MKTKKQIEKRIEYLIQRKLEIKKDRLCIDMPELKIYIDLENTIQILLWVLKNEGKR